MQRKSSLFILEALVLGVLLTVSASAQAMPALLARPLERDGLHFQVAFGWGGGPTSHGLLHNMELGTTFSHRGLTLAYDHVFVYSDGFFKPEGGSDLFGGHMLVFKSPLLYTEIVPKIAIGLGENVDMSDGFKPSFGFGWLYGVDFDLPLWPTSGITAGIMAFHAVTVDVGHQFAGGVTLGYTWF